MTPSNPEPRQQFLWKEKGNAYITVALLIATLAAYMLLSRYLGLPGNWYETQGGMMIAGLIVAMDLLIGMRYDARIIRRREARRRQELARSKATYRVRRRNRPEDQSYTVQWRHVDGKVKLIRLEDEAEVYGAGLVGELLSTEGEVE